MRAATDAAGGPRVAMRAEAFGEAMPMACDDTGWGRQVNRRVEVWVPTQNATASLEAAARAAGVDPLQVEVHNTQLGGGFGRRLRNDFMVECAWIAREVERDVRAGVMSLNAMMLRGGQTLGPVFASAGYAVAGIEGAFAVGVLASIALLVLVAGLER